MFNNCTCEAFVVRLGLKPRLVSAKRFSEPIKRGNVLICAKQKATQSFYLWEYKRSGFVFLPLTASQHLICCLLMEKTVHRGSKKLSVFQYFTSAV